MTLKYRLLDDRFIRYRDVDGTSHEVTLPELFVALARDTVRDFPALRPHQRHPWHAFLVQLAAIATNQTSFPETADAWRAALLALTPDDPDGAAYALVSPDDRPALLQAPCKRGESRAWKKRLSTPDALDMLVTSKNHDVKAARMMRARPCDWLFALVSLQTQEGFLGAGNYGISRMNGGFASRSAFGIVPAGYCGKRWKRDVQLLLDDRDEIVSVQSLKEEGGLALVWLRAWDGVSSLAFDTLDPFYIEICRRIRLVEHDGKLYASSTSSKAARIAAKERNGKTGDAWTPVDIAQSKALSITSRGFTYTLMHTLAFKGKYEPTIAQQLHAEDDADGVSLLAQAVTRGQGKTEGYHERRILVPYRFRREILAGRADDLAKASGRRITAISDVRKVLWSALCALFSNGAKTASDDTKEKAGDFARLFELEEDRRFFDDLFVETECETPEAREKAHEAWLCELVDRALRVLKNAFDSGPRAIMRRYRARSAALGRFRIGLRYSKQAPKEIARVLNERDAKGTSPKELSDTNRI